MAFNILNTDEITITWSYGQPSTPYIHIIRPFYMEKWWTMLSIFFPPWFGHSLKLWSLHPGWPGPIAFADQRSWCPRLNWLNALVISRRTFGEAKAFESVSPVARVDDRFLFRQSAFLKFFWSFGLCAVLFFQSRNPGETGDLVLALQDRAPAPGRAAAKLPCLDLRCHELRRENDAWRCDAQGPSLGSGSASTPHCYGTIVLFGGATFCSSLSVDLFVFAVLNWNTTALYQNLWLMSLSLFLRVLSWSIFSFTCC